MAMALKTEASLSHGESIDQYMDTQKCETLVAQIDKQKAKELAALNKSDPNYAKRAKEIESRAKQTKYKAMKSLNV